MTTYEKGTYCIGVTRDGKKPRPFLFKVSGSSKGIVSGIVEKNSHIQQLRNAIEVPAKDIIIDLGTDPYPGKVHGADTSLIYKGRKHNDNFGTIHWFYKPEPEVGQALNAAFDKSFKTLKQARLDFIVDPLTCIWEALPFNGERYAGMYMRSKDVEKKPNRFQIRPEIMPATEYGYVIFHELGHHLQSEYATGKKLNAAWVRLYNTSIKLKSIKKEESTDLLERLLANRENLPSDFKTELSEEETAVYKMILKTIARQHSLSVKELDLLFEAEYFDDIKAVWPTRGVSEKDLAPIISEYATKNYRELFAESFAFYMTKKTLPKDVAALMEKTLSYARSNHEKR